MFMSLHVNVVDALLFLLIFFCLLVGGICALLPVFQNLPRLIPHLILKVVQTKSIYRLLQASIMYIYKIYFKPFALLTFTHRLLWSKLMTLIMSTLHVHVIQYLVSHLHA